MITKTESVENARRTAVLAGVLVQMLRPRHTTRSDGRSRRVVWCGLNVRTTDRVPRTDRSTDAQNLTVARKTVQGAVESYLLRPKIVKTRAALAVGSRSSCLQTVIYQQLCLLRETYHDTILLQSTFVTVYSTVMAQTVFS